MCDFISSLIFTKILTLLSTRFHKYGDVFNVKSTPVITSEQSGRSNDIEKRPIYF